MVNHFVGSMQTCSVSTACGSTPSPHTLDALCKIAKIARGSLQIELVYHMSISMTGLTVVDVFLQGLDISDSFHTVLANWLGKAELGRSMVYDLSHLLQCLCKSEQPLLIEAV